MKDWFYMQMGRQIVRKRHWLCGRLPLKVALQILGRKFYKNTKKSSLYSQSRLISIHKTQVVESHPTTTEIRDLLRPRSVHRRETR